MNLQQQAKELLERQKRSWPMLRENLEGLSSAHLRVLNFPGYTIRAQFNPKRITSSAARVDRESIARRRCFLCHENHPPEQESVPFGDYEILCNPFPIFDSHFTIAHREHTPQEIRPEFGSLLELSRELPELVVFYNGPGSGASAPDHMHFQAGNRGFIPIGKESGSLEKQYGEDFLAGARSGPGRMVAVDDGLRRFIIMESGSRAFLEDAFDSIYSFAEGPGPGEEPMLNILSAFSDRWQVLVFPRERHRPWQYFEQGERNILLSPASVEMGGTLVIPLEKDFVKITREDIGDIFSQVTIPADRFRQLVVHLKNRFH